MTYKVFFSSEFISSLIFTNSAGFKGNNYNIGWSKISESILYSSVMLLDLPTNFIIKLTATVRSNKGISSFKDLIFGKMSSF